MQGSDGLGQYEELLDDVLHEGVRKSDRTGTGTRSLFGRQLRYNLAHGFPLITTKKVHLKSIVGELLWFLRGETNVRWLQEQGIKIWDAWADESGDLGRVYGAQWRSWTDSNGDGIDQISRAIQLLETDPDSRRIIVSAWNVGELDQMALMPCHTLFQFYVADGKLSCHIYQRSADLFLGVPFNIASYALLTHMMARQVGLEAGELVWTGGDCHIYDNHVDQVGEQLRRNVPAFPTLEMKSVASIFDYAIEDVSVVNYNPHPALKGKVAV